MIDFRGHIPFLDGLRGIAVIWFSCFTVRPQKSSGYSNWGGLVLIYFLSYMAFLLQGFYWTLKIQKTISKTSLREDF